MSYNYRQLLCASVCCAGDMTSACYSWLFIFSLGVSCELFCHLRCVVWCVSQRRTKSCQRNCLGQGQPNAQSQSRILHSCFFALVSACSCRFIEDACRVPTLISFFHRIILLRILLLHTMRSTKIVSLHLFLSLSLLLLYSQLHWCGRRAWWEIAFFVLFGFFRALLSHGTFIIVQKEPTPSLSSSSSPLSSFVAWFHYLVATLSRPVNVSMPAARTCNCGIANRLYTRGDQHRALRESLKLCLMRF